MAETSALYHVCSVRHRQLTFINCGLSVSLEMKLGSGSVYCSLV